MMTPKKIIKKLNARGVRFNTTENKDLVQDELSQALFNSVKAYRYAFNVDVNDEVKSVARFVLETKKKVRNANGEKLRQARIYFPIEEIKDFFNKFNLDGKGFVEGKLVFYLADLGNDTTAYYIISEDVLDEIMDMEGYQDGEEDCQNEE